MQKNNEKGRLAIININEMTVKRTAQRAVCSTISAETRYANLDKLNRKLISHFSFD